MANEYIRDLEKMGDKAPFPVHYFPDDNPSLEPQKTWNAHGQLLYSNWLNYYVYQTTPFDMSQVGVLHADLAEVTSDVGAFTITAAGKDKVGILAKLSTALANLGVAIEDINQEVNADNFQIVIHAHVATDNSSWADIQQCMENLGKAEGIDVKAFHADAETHDA